MSHNQTSKRVIFVGPPGSGKGTQAKILSQAHNLPHLSTGDLLRKEIQLSSDLGAKAKQYVDRGELVPDDVFLKILESNLSSEACNNGWILDGFPRTSSQAVFLDRFLNDQSTEVDIVLFLSVPDDLVVSRLLRRSELESRSDDRESLIRKRLDIYGEQTLPVIDFYTEKGVLFKVDGSGSESEVAHKINALMSG